MLSLNNPITILYNGNNLSQVNGLNILNRVVNDFPRRDLRQFKLARQDASITTTAEFQDKTVSLDGVILADSRVNAELAIDQLRALLADIEGELDVPVGGNTRRFIATLQGMSTKITGGFVQFTLQFMCSDPFGSDLLPVTLLSGSANTASTANYAVAIEGSYRAEPLLTFTFSALTGGTGAQVEVFNTVDNVGLTIVRNWTAGDILEIDNLNKTCKVNGVDVARTGRFFFFQPGSRSIGYSDNLSTRTTALTASYTKRYV